MGDDEEEGDPIDILIEAFAELEALTKMDRTVGW